MKHNLSSAVVMMLINEGFLQESDEDEAVDSVDDLFTDWFAQSTTDLDFPWDED
tara:strand:+ start:209 stop:370 length:162 start_codon:yes stop_codon:yes gene_type:complete